MKNPSRLPRIGNENFSETIIPSIEEIELDDMANLALIITSLIQGTNPKIDSTVCFSIVYDTILLGADPEEAFEKGKLIAAKELGTVQ